MLDLDSLIPGSTTGGSGESDTPPPISPFVDNLIQIPEIAPIPGEVPEARGHLGSLGYGFGTMLQTVERAVGTKENAEVIGKANENLGPRRYESVKDVENAWDAAGFALEAFEEQAANLMMLAPAAIAGGSIAPIAGTAATVGALGVSHTGESLMALDDEGVENPTFAQAAPAAAINTTLDAVGFKKMAEILRVGKYLGMPSKVQKIVTDTSKSMAGKFAKGTAEVAGVGAIEGTTEVSQDIINTINAALMNDKDFKTAYDKALADGDQLIDTFARGMAGAAVPAIGVKILTPAEIKKRDEAVPETEPMPGAPNPDTDGTPTVPEAAPPVGETTIPEVETPPVPEVPPVVTPPVMEEPTGPFDIWGPPEPTFVGPPMAPEGPRTPVDWVKPPDIVEPINRTAPPVEEVAPIAPEVIAKDPEKFLQIQLTDEESGPRYSVIDLRGERNPEEAAKDYANLFTKVNEMVTDLKFPELKGKMMYAMNHTVKAIARGNYQSNHFVPKGRRFETTPETATVYTSNGEMHRTIDVVNDFEPGVYANLEGAERHGIPGLPAELISRIEKAVAVIHQQYMPDSHIVVGVSKKERSSSTGATHAGFVTEGKKVSEILINTRAKTLSALREKYGENSYRYQDEVYHQVLHEVGHSFLLNNLNDMPSALRAKMLEEYFTILKAINTGITYDKFLQLRYSPYTYRTIKARLRKTTLDSQAKDILDQYGTVESRKYGLDFEEFMAEKLAGEFLKADGIKNSEAIGFFRTLVATWKKFLKDNFAPKEASSIYREVLDVMRMKADLDKYFTAMDMEDIKQNLREALGVDTILPMPEGRLWHKDYDSRQDKLDKYAGMIHGSPSILESRMEDHLEKFDKGYRIASGFRRWKAYIMSPSQIARRYRFKEAQAYMEEVRKYAATKMQGISQADELATAWRNLSPEHEDTLGAYMFELSEQSDKLKRKLSPAELKLLQDSYKMSPHMRELAGKLEASFTEVLTRTKRATEKDIVRLFVKEPDRFLEGYRELKTPRTRTQYIMSWLNNDEKATMEMIMELGKVDRQFYMLENKNYFPRMRFGELAIVVKEINKDGTARVADFMMYETRESYDKALRQLQEIYPAGGNVEVRGTQLDDTAKSLWGMPQIVIDRVQDALIKTGTGLTEDQIDVIRGLALDMSPGKRHMRHMQKREHITGHSVDALRTYATYMSNASNHLARVEHITSLTGLIKEMELAEKSHVGDTSDLAAMASYYREHFKYIMNPENDLAALRNLGFLWYLGFNPKSALVNLTQLPMVTYPWLAARFSDAKATKAMTLATKDVSLHITKGKQLTEGEQAYFDQMTREGVFDESFAMELSALGNTSLIARLTKKKGVDRKIGQFTYAAGYMFSAMEKYNRRITGLSAYRLAVSEKNLSHEEAAAFARDSIMQTQFEYAKWDRAELMRGKKSAVFLFMNYTQSFLYTAFAGDGNAQARATALRMWGVMFLVAGIQGLPGSEYALSLLDFFKNMYNRMFGIRNSKANSRLAIREYVNRAIDPYSPFEKGVASDLLLHGSSRYGFGAGLMSRALFNTGFDLDISGSVSMGAPLQFGRAQTRDGYQFSDFLQEASGPIGNIVAETWKATTSKDPDEWKRFEKILPVAAKNFSKGARYMVRGEETFMSGATFKDMSENQAENFAQMIGFTPTSLAQRREMYGEQLQQSMYWNNRRKAYLDEYNLAIEQGDFPKVKEIKLEIKEFNKELDSPRTRKFKITGANLAASKKARSRNNKKKENFEPVIKREKKIYEHIQGEYPEM